MSHTRLQSRLWPVIMPSVYVGGAPVRANLRGAPSGVAQLAERRTVNPLVVGSIPTPGADKGTPLGSLWSLWAYFRDRNVGAVAQW